MILLEIYRLNPQTSEITLIDVIDTYQGLRFLDRKSNIGEASFALNVDDPKATGNNLLRYSTIVAVKDNGVIVWAGPIINVSLSYDEDFGNIQVECSSPLYWLSRRYTDKIKYYEQTEQGDIAWDLIDIVQSRTNGGMGISEGASIASQARDRTYEYYPISEALVNLSNVINGFDFDFTYDVDADGFLIGFLFNRYYPGQGRVRDDLAPLNIADHMNNIKASSRSSLVNNIILKGAGFGENVPNSTSEDTASQQKHSRLELVRSESIELQTTLDNRADELIDSLKGDSTQFEFDLKPGSSITYRAFGLGDTLNANIQLGNYINFQGQLKVEEIETKVDSEGARFMRPTVNIIS